MKPEGTVEFLIGGGEKPVTHSTKYKMALAAYAFVEVCSAYGSRNLYGLSAFLAGCLGFILGVSAGLYVYFNKRLPSKN